MRTLYIFKLKKDLLSIAKTNPFNIYIVFSTIYYTNKQDIEKAYDLFYKTTNSINKSFLTSYLKTKLQNKEEYTVFKNIHMYNNYYTKEVSKLTINNHYITIKTNTINNIFLLELVNFYNLFACDFENKEYILINKNNISCKNERHLV